MCVSREASLLLCVKWKLISDNWKVKLIVNSSLVVNAKATRTVWFYKKIMYATFGLVLDAYYNKVRDRIGLAEKLTVTKWTFYV